MGSKWYSIKKKKIKKKEMYELFFPLRDLHKKLQLERTSAAKHHFVSTHD